MRYYLHNNTIYCILVAINYTMKQEENFQQSGQRQLKVYEKHISRSYYQRVIFPEIRLCGKWLQDIGFECGQTVTVQHQKNKIIITLDNKIVTDE